MKIVLTGGGTLGSVSPIIGIWQALKSRKEIKGLFIGTKKGPEKEFLNQYEDLSFKAIPAGKLRRYFSLKNLIDPFFIFFGFLKSYFILKKFKPDFIISAGSYVAVPVCLAAKILGIKIHIHQLDFQPTLTNKLLEKQADLITVTFKKSLNDFDPQKTYLVGSCLRSEIIALAKTETGEKHLFILGGGTGAKYINELVYNSLPLINNEILITHITGRGKSQAGFEDYANYSQFEFLTKSYYQKISKSDIVVTRAGLSTLLELSFLKKPVITIPIPNSHQEKNAKYFLDKRAAIFLEQNKITEEDFAEVVNNLFSTQAKQEQLAENIFKAVKHGGEEKVADLILEII